MLAKNKLIITQVYSKMFNAKIEEVETMLDIEYSIDKYFYFLKYSY